MAIMTDEKLGQPEFIDLPPDVEARYLAELHAKIEQLQPVHAEDHILQSTERLYLAYRRAFDTMGYTPLRRGTLVEPGIGTAPCLAAVQAVFDPADHIGIDVKPDRVSEIQQNYRGLPAEGPGSVRTVTADAMDPRQIPGYDASRPVDTVAMLHPDVADIETERERDDGVFVTDEKMVKQVYNWLQMVQPEGVFVMTNIFPEEAESIVNDPELRKYIYLCGITALLPEDLMDDHGYIVVMRPVPRADGQEMIVWRNEQYKDYDALHAHKYNPDLRITTPLPGSDNAGES